MTRAAVEYGIWNTTAKMTDNARVDAPSRLVLVVWNSTVHESVERDRNKDVVVVVLREA